MEFKKDADQDHHANARDDEETGPGMKASFIADHMFNLLFVSFFEFEPGIESDQTTDQKQKRNTSAQKITEIVC